MNETLLRLLLLREGLFHWSMFHQQGFYFPSPATYLHQESRFSSINNGLPLGILNVYLPNFIFLTYYRNTNYLFFTFRSHHNSEKLKYKFSCNHERIRYSYSVWSCAIWVFLFFQIKLLSAQKLRTARSKSVKTIFLLWWTLIMCSFPSAWSHLILMKKVLIKGDHIC